MREKSRSSNSIFNFHLRLGISPLAHWLLVPKIRESNLYFVCRFVVLLWTLWSIPTEEVTISISVKPPPSGGAPAPVRRSVLLPPGELVGSGEERSSTRMTSKLYERYTIDNKYHADPMQDFYFSAIHFGILRKWKNFDIARTLNLLWQFLKNHFIQK